MRIVKRVARRKLIIPQHLTSSVANSPHQWLLLPKKGSPPNILAADTFWIAEHCYTVVTPGNIPGTFDAEVWYFDFAHRWARELTTHDVRGLPLGFKIGLPPHKMRRWMARTDIVVPKILERFLHDLPANHPCVKDNIPGITDERNITILDGCGPSVKPSKCNTMTLRQWMLRVYWETEYGRVLSQTWAQNPAVLAMLVMTTENRCMPRQRLAMNHMTR